MPLIKSSSHKAFQHNLKAELSAGKPKNQALAIAYTEAGEKKANGGLMEKHDEMQDMDQMMDQVAHELMEGIEKKDSKMVMDALTALVLHIQDADQDQDSEMMEMKP